MKYAQQHKSEHQANKDAERKRSQGFSNVSVSKESDFVDKSDVWVVRWEDGTSFADTIRKHPEHPANRKKATKFLPDTETRVKALRQRYGSKAMTWQKTAGQWESGRFSIYSAWESGNRIWVLFDHQKQSVAGKFGSVPQAKRAAEEYSKA